MSSQGTIPQRTSPPYFPTTWALGGAPDPQVDIPITAVFLALYIVGAITHMTILQINLRRSHKFLFSGALFGFCMSRIVTTILRIASISLPTNIRLSIAASIFVAAGVLLIFVINLLFTQRILRALHPRFGWSQGLSWFLKAHYILIVLTLAMTITTVVQSFYTLNIHTKTIDRDVQLYAQAFFVYFSFLPIPTILLALLLPRTAPTDPFGSGTLRSKILILLTAAALVCLGATYRAATNFHPWVPRAQPLPALFAKPAFYLVNFGVEIVVVYLYAMVRIDRRFHVPDGARGQGSYGLNAAAEKTHGEWVVESEEEAFGGVVPPGGAQEETGDSRV